MVHNMRGTVANRLTSFNLADLQDSSPQSNDLTRRVRTAGLRVDTVKSSTRTNEVEVKPGPEKNSRRSGQARGQSAEVPVHGCEARALEIVQRMLGLVGAGEMANKATPPGCAFLRKLVDEPRELPRS